MNILLLQDSTITFTKLTEKDQTHTIYLGRSLDLILGIRNCSVNRMTLCVTSDPEMDKCIKMKVCLKQYV